MKIIGDTNVFAFEIGSYLNPLLRTVDIWAGGARLCTEDDAAFVGQFVCSLRPETEKSYDVAPFWQHLQGKTPEEMAAFVSSTRKKDSPNYDLFDDEIFLTYQVLDLGPTTDNINAFLFRKDTKADFVYSLPREDERSGRPETFHAVSLNFDFFISVLKDSADFLSKEMIEQNGAPSSQNATLLGNLKHHSS